MGLADYFHRSAVAAAQVLNGFDEDAISQRLEQTSIEINVNDTESPEVKSLVDLSVRLLARFYPKLRFSGSANMTNQVELAKAINPNIEIVTGKCDFGIGIGSNANPECKTSIFAGSEGWDALVSPKTPRVLA